MAPQAQGLETFLLEKCHTIWSKITQLLYAQILLYICEIILLFFIKKVSFLSKCPRKSCNLQICYLLQKLHATQWFFQPRKFKNLMGFINILEISLQDKIKSLNWIFNLSSQKHFSFFLQHWKKPWMSLLLLIIFPYRESILVHVRFRSLQTKQQNILFSRKVTKKRLLMYCTSKMKASFSK